MSNLLSEVHSELIGEWSDKNLHLTPIGAGNREEHKKSHNFKIYGQFHYGIAHFLKRKKTECELLKTAATVSCLFTECTHAIIFTRW